MSSNNRHYGTTATGQNGTIRSADEETAGLLGKTKSGSLGTRLHKHFTTNVSSTWGDVALLFCYVITGLLDSSSVATWGSFASMQTGKNITTNLLANANMMNRKLDLRGRGYHSTEGERSLAASFGIDCKLLNGQLHLREISSILLSEETLGHRFILHHSASHGDSGGSNGDGRTIDNSKESHHRLGACAYRPSGIPVCGSSSHQQGVEVQQSYKCCAD